MEESQLEQRDALATTDWSILFLLLLIVSILLSFAATVEQRDGLARLVFCGQEDPTDVFPTRWLVSVLVVGATGFFAWSACSSMRKTLRQGDRAERRSARANLLAAVLVFTAALIRMNDLELIGRDRQNAALEETLTPE